MSEQHSKSKPWEMFNGWYIIGFVREEGGIIEFDSIYETQKEAQKQYRKLLKQQDIYCMVFATKVVSSMDKIVRYVMDKEAGKDPREKHPFVRQFLEGFPSLPSGKEGFYQIVVQYIKALVEKEDASGKGNGKVV